MTDRKPQGITWESFAEQQIREAQDAGEFDDLPGFGQPLADIDEPYDEMWWLKKKIERERLSLTPPGIEIRADVERTLASVWRLTTEADVRETVAALNDRITRANFRAVWGPPSTTMTLDIDHLVEEWRARRHR